MTITAVSQPPYLSVLLCMPPCVCHVELAGGQAQSTVQHVHAMGSSTTSEVSGPEPAVSTTLTPDVRPYLLHHNPCWLTPILLAPLTTHHTCAARCLRWTATWRWMCWACPS
jgi:hypothetical protein